MPRANISLAVSNIDMGISAGVGEPDMVLIEFLHSDKRAGDYLKEKKVQLLRRLAHFRRKSEPHQTCTSHLSSYFLNHVIKKKTHAGWRQ